jgi:predicted glycosyltransferase
MKSDELEDTLNKTEIVISRSGYTTIMDLAMLEKKAFFIPTPGQYEQEYLAKRLKNLGIVPSCKQENFNMEKLDKVMVYKGLKTLSNQPVNFSELFSLFESE